MGKKKKKHRYILVPYRNIGFGFNIPLRYFPDKNRKRKPGPVEKFKPEYIRIAGLCCRELGADIKQLCKIFNVIKPTLYRWMYKYPEFQKSIKDNRDMWNVYKVERTLLARALGIEYEEVKKEMIKINGKYSDGLQVKLPATKITKTKKFVPGDPSCLFFYLQNRDPNRWRNTKFLQLSGEVTAKHEGTVKLDQLRKLEKNDVKKLKDVYDKLKAPVTRKRSLEV